MAERIVAAPSSALPGLTPWLNRGLEFLWLVAVFLVPLAYLNDSSMVSEAAIAYLEVPKIAVLRTLAGMMAILWLIEWSIQGRLPFEALLRRKDPTAGLGKDLVGWLRERPTRWLFLAVWFFLGTTLLSTIFSGSFKISMWGEIPGQDGYPLYTVAAYILLFSVIATHLRTRSQLWRLMGAIIAMGFLVAGYAMAQHYSFDFLNLTESTGGGSGRVTVFMGNSLFAGALLSMIVPLSLVAASYSLREPAWTTWNRWSDLRPLVLPVALAGLWGFVLAVQVLGIAFTFARGPWVATLVTIVAFLGGSTLLLGWRTFLRSTLVLGMALVMGVAMLQGFTSVAVLGMGPWFAVIIALVGFLGLAIFFMAWRTFGDRALAVTVAIALAISLAAGVFLVPSLVTSTGGDSSEPGTASAVADRFTSIKGQVLSGAIGGRRTHWEVSWELFKDRPWFDFDTLSFSWLRPFIGYGPDLFRYTYLLESPSEGIDLLPLEPDHAHNFFIHHAIEQGLLGLISTLGLFAAVFTMGVQLLLRERKSYSAAYLLILIGLLAAVAGRFLEMMVGVARVSDLTVLWVLFAMLAALPRVMQGPVTEPEPASQPPPSRPRNRHRRLRLKGAPNDNRRLGLRLALVAVLVLAVALVTWTKTVSNVRAAAVAGDAAESFRQGDLQAALTGLNRAIELAPDVPVYHNYRASVYLTYQIKQASPREPECSIGENPAYEQCLAFRSYQSNLAGADRRPFYYRSHLALANSAYNLRGTEYDLTRGGEVVTVKLRDETVRFYRESVALVPNSWRIANELADAYLQAGQSQAALDTLAESLAATGDTALSRRALFLQGKAYKELGELDKITTSLEHALENGLSGDSALEAREILAEAYKGLSQAELSAELLRRLGESYQLSGNVEEATDFFERAIEEYETLGQTELVAELLFSLAREYQGLGEDQRAATFFERTVDAYGRLNRTELATQLLYSLAEEYQALGETQLAESYFARTIRAYETTDQPELAVDLLKRRGEAYLDSGNASEAATFFERAISGYAKLGRTDLAADLLHSLGEKYQKLGRSQEAARYLKRSTEISSLEGEPGLTAQSFYILGLAYAALGDLQGSVASLNRAFAMDTTGALKHLVHLKLAELYGDAVQKELETVAGIPKAELSPDLTSLERVAAAAIRSGGAFEKFDQPDMAPRFLYQLGLAFLDDGPYDNAFIHLHNSAQMFVALGQQEEAAQAFMQTLSAYRLLPIGFMLSRYGEALELTWPLYDTLEDSAAAAELHFQLGDALLERYDSQASANSFERSSRIYLDLEQSPLAAESFFRLGQVYQQQGELEKSAQALERSLELAGDGAGARDANDVLAQVYTSLGRTELAEKHRALAGR